MNQLAVIISNNYCTFVHVINFAILLKPLYNNRANPRHREKVLRNIYSSETSEKQ